MSESQSTATSTPGHEQQTLPEPWGSSVGAQQDPGRTLSIVGLVLAFLAAPVGLMISIMAKVKSKKASVKNRLSTGGIVVGIALTVVWVTLMIVGVLIVISVANRCGDLGPGVHQVHGVTYKCGG